MLRLLLLLAAQTQALRTPPTRPLRIRHRAVTTPTPDEVRTNRVALTFPVLTVAAAALGRAAPRTVAATLGTKAAFRRGLALLMVSMGLTLTPTDLKRASNSPRALAINAVCCFAVAPLASIACATALGLDADARAGLLLLGCVSGGQASNLCALLGGGDAALSVVLTTSTTLLGCVATPFLASRLLRSTIAVDGGAILASTASLVLAPLGAGVLTAALFPRVARRLRPFCAPAGIVSTSLLVAGGAAARSEVETLSLIHI